MNAEQRTINLLYKISEALTTANLQNLDVTPKGQIYEYLQGKVDAYKMMMDTIKEYVKEDDNE